MLRLTLCVFGLAAVLAASLRSQSTMLGRAADPASGSDDVLVVREHSPATGEGYGTMSAASAFFLLDQIGRMAEMGFAEAAGSTPSVHPAAPFDRGDPLVAAEVTVNLLRLLRITPALGRDFVDADVQQKHLTAIVTHRVWQTRFGGRTEILGARASQTDQDGLRHDVVFVGVLPPASATTPEIDPNADVLVLSRLGFEMRRPSDRIVAPLIRPRPGITAAEIQKRLNTAAAVLNDTGQSASRLAFRLESLRRLPR